MREQVAIQFLTTVLFSVLLFLVVDCRVRHQIIEIQISEVFQTYWNGLSNEQKQIVKSQLVNIQQQQKHQKNDSNKYNFFILCIRAFVFVLLCVAFVFVFVTRDIRASDFSRELLFTFIESSMVYVVFIICLYTQQKFISPKDYERMFFPTTGTGTSTASK